MSPVNQSGDREGAKWNVLVVFIERVSRWPSGKKKFLLPMQEIGFNSWVRKIPWRRKWQPIPVFLPGESHGQRNMAGYHPRGGKESDTTEAT